jgi:hypothetical protein
MKASVPAGWLMRLQRHWRFASQSMPNNLKKSVGLMC